ncbi:MAG: DUF2784 domain-containing protein [Gemmatimonadota bacterium]|nr:MAG: DUF2784 domain-containing protein [Gemmatimonadota bacterium]
MRRWTAESGARRGRPARSRIKSSNGRYDKSHQPCGGRGERQRRRRCRGVRVGVAESSLLLSTGQKRRGGANVVYRALADFAVVVHLAFVVFAVGGALLVLRWRRVIWLHLPAMVWAALIEYAGWICPLTPLENRLRTLGGEYGYSGGFIDHYLLPVLYPRGLTRGAQVVLGSLVVAINLAIYGWLIWRRRWARAD